MEIQCKLKFNHFKNSQGKMGIANTVVDYSLEWLSTVFPSVQWKPNQTPITDDSLIELFNMHTDLTCFIYQFFIDIDERDFNKAKLIQKQLLHRMFNEYLILGYEVVPSVDDPIDWKSGFCLKLSKPYYWCDKL